MIDNYAGYYRCNNKIFISKVDALIYARVSNKPIEWIFHDKELGAINWAQDPDGTIDDYYNLRARELREKYDYIIISYSAGADSETVLQSFLRQGLKVDEILTNHLTKANKSIAVSNPDIKSSWNFHAEYELNVIPRLKWIHDNHPEIKITVRDVSEIAVDSIKDDHTWFLGKNDHLAPGQLFRNNYWYFNEIRQTFDKNLKIGIITGGDKPRTYIENDTMYLFFIDFTANITTIGEFNEVNDNVKTEMFFHGPTTGLLVAKQVHVIKQWLESNPEMQQYWRNFTTDKYRLYHERLLRPLLYPTTWDDTSYQADKSTQWWNTEFDTWFRTNPEFASKYELWQKGINWLHSHLGDQYVKIGRKGVPDQFMPFKKTYTIGTIKENVQKV
jgi:hypothetical protein